MAKRTRKSKTARVRKVSPRRRSPRASTPAANTKGTLTPEPNELIVRMYRQGLGDCFLLALPGTDGRPRYLLIDCGVHARQTKGPERLTQVLDDIVRTTGARLDVVVATHEHADHLSGFVQKGSPFLLDTLPVDEVWLAWTEKRGDNQADTLRKKRGTARAVIEKAVEEARNRAGQAGVALADHLTLLTDFESPTTNSVDEQSVAAAIAKIAGRSSPGTADTTVSYQESAGMANSKKQKKKVRPTSNELALSLLVAKTGEECVKYCNPGDVRTVDGVDGFRAHVLSPPRTDLLERDRPTKIRGATEDTPGGMYKEVYLTAFGTNRALELSPRFGLDVTAEGGALPSAWRLPFVEQLSRQCDVSAPAGAGVRKRWPATLHESTRAFVDSTYFDPSQQWRRIDGDWLGAAETLALNLVGDTNNTSLVLAIEWGEPGSGQVLLFAADAQVGNWLSWRDQKYDGKKVTADELMRRVVLYKVGHHGSHNATVRRDPREQSDSDPLGVPFGLELMNDIIAMIPVDTDAAQKKMPDPWRMPHEPLYRRLRERSRGRVLRSDEQITPLHPPDDDPDRVPRSKTWTAVPGLRGVRWRASKERFRMGTQGPLYYDVAFTRQG